ncbi:hypothetical protein FPCIR_11587 [Fusarium pseudocircinatum]|uniref:2EXR domain-containing protein n=1 Tax=Fusarium pseudocircinatum TaxID=56676 RepID=A0A8H5KQY9_9HYPO|nr:hypothetical protein FPCIR_11587 [Fusarium pseudocircinatum]
MIQLVTKLFNRQSLNSDNEHNTDNEPNSDNKPKGAFYRFSQLPQEIQNMVWAYALCVDAPRAYFVDVKDWFGQPCQVKALHTIPRSLGDFPPPPASNLNSDYGLMRVCRASYEEVARSWNLWRPRVPARMVLSNTHDGGMRSKKFSSLYIDASSDLVLVDKWFAQWRINRPFVSSLAEVTCFISPGNDRYQGLENIKTVAVTVDSDLERSYEPRYMVHLEALFPELRTLYLYLQPKFLVPADSRQQEMPVDFLAPEPRKDQAPPARFLACGRIIYEICPKEMRLAGLHVPIFKDDAVDIKFMTWQWI